MISDTKQNVCNFLWKKLKKLKITQKQISKVLHVRQCEVNQRFQAGDFTLEELLMLFAITGSTKEEIGEVMYEKDNYRL